VVLAWRGREWALLPSPSQFPTSLEIWRQEMQRAAQCGRCLHTEAAASFGSFLVGEPSLCARVLQPSHGKSLCKGFADARRKLEMPIPPPEFSPRLPDLPLLRILHMLFQLPLADSLFWLFQGVVQRLKPKLFKKNKNNLSNSS